jgi:hypothetical protein
VRHSNIVGKPPLSNTLNSAKAGERQKNPPLSPFDKGGGKGDSHCSFGC